MIAARTPEPHARPYLSGGDGTVQAFVGKPWASGASGPDAFDCWGLTCAAALDLFGVAFPVALYADTAPRTVASVASDVLTMPEWRERPTAQRGAILALCGFEGDVRHVALCLDATRCLHIARATRSCVVPVVKLAAMYPLARFYEWAP